MMMAALDDEETQLKGMTVIVYHFGRDPESVQEWMADRMNTWQMNRLQRVLPIRPVGLHFCFNNPTMKKLVSLAMSLNARGERAARIRAHDGTLF